MRIISIIIVLLIVAYLVSKQLTPETSSRSANGTMENTQDVTAPIVPTAPQDVNNFKNDMNKYIQDTASERGEELDRIEGL